MSYKHFKFELDKIRQRKSENTRCAAILQCSYVAYVAQSLNENKYNDFFIYNFYFLLIIFCNYLKNYN